MMWNVASLAQADTADTKSHSAAKSVGTPTRGRYCARQSLSCWMITRRTSTGTPSESVVGIQRFLDMCLEMRARACAAR